MNIKLNKKITSGVFMGAMLIAFAGCSGKSDAQTAKDTAAADHKAAPVAAPALDVPSGTYVMDKTHGYVTFSYLHKGLSHPQLRFNNVDATIELDAENPQESYVDVTIMAASIDSGVAKFDTHLNSPDFFNTAINPEITFESTAFTRVDATSGTMTGDLTMMGLSKPISFDVVLIGTNNGDDAAIGVEGRTKLMRSDWNLGKYVPYVGDEVSIVISAEFHKQE